MLLDICPHAHLFHPDIYPSPKITVADSAPAPDRVDEQQVTLLGLLDLSAAFDCVDRDVLLQRLRTKFDITGTLLSWITSFLQDRTQQVFYKRCRLPFRVLSDPNANLTLKPSPNTNLMSSQP